MEQVTPGNFHAVKKQVVLKILLRTMIVFFCVLGLINLIQKDFLHLPVDIILIGIFIYLKFLSRKKKYIEVTLTVFIASLGAAMFYLFFDGGYNGTGPIYAIIFPLPTIFLLGEKKGTIVTSVAAIIQIVLYILFIGKPWFPNYNTELVFRFLIVYVAVVLFSYSFVIAINTLYKSFTQTYNSLQDTTEEYKELALVREKFISVFTHDFRGHVGTLYNMAQLVRMRYDKWDDEKRLKMISAIEELAEKNIGFCNSLLSWVLVKHGRMPLNKTKNDINETISSAIDLLKERFAEKKITLTYNCDNPVYYNYDNDMISSVVRNLISNAIKFSPEKSSITIDVTEGEGLKVSITDSGVGIKSSVKNKLFKLDEFHSVTGTANEKGTGMGLILCKEFIEKHDGVIDFTSKENEGTTFNFVLPKNSKYEEVPV